MLHETWTVERLDALPAHTVIEWGDIDTAWFVFDGEYWNHTELDQALTSADLLSDSGGSIRVVSVPIDALLAEGVMDAVCDVLDEDGHNGYDCRPERPADATAKRAIRAAVAHITGEATA